MVLKINSRMEHQYNFELLGPQGDELSREIKKELDVKIKYLLIELGESFFFVRKEYIMYSIEKDYIINLSFAHSKLRCYVEIEIKASKAKSEYMGRFNFFISNIDFRQEKEVESDLQN